MIYPKEDEDDDNKEDNNNGDVKTNAMMYVLSCEFTCFFLYMDVEESKNDEKDDGKIGNENKHWYVTTRAYSPLLFVDDEGGGNDGQDDM